MKSKLKPAIAFDASGVLFRGRQPIPRAKQALDLLQKYKVPFVVLTNAGGKTESKRAELFNKILDTKIFNKKNVIQAHTPMKMLFHMKMLKGEDDGLVLIGGSQDVHEIADEYDFTNYITVEEMAALFPFLIPLSHKAEYPSEQRTKECIERVTDRFQTIDFENDILKKKFASVMLFSNPFMYETHMQIISDVMASQGGIIGTLRPKDSIQSTDLYFAHEDLLVPS